MNPHLTASAAPEAAQRVRCTVSPVVRPLTGRQILALATIHKAWASVNMTGISSATLVSLQHRGLIEGRISPGTNPSIVLDRPYNSFAYQWRLRPNASPDRTGGNPNE